MLSRVIQQSSPLLHLPRQQKICGYDAIVKTYVDHAKSFDYAGLNALLMMEWE